DAAHGLRALLAVAADRRPERRWPAGAGQGPRRVLSSAACAPAFSQSAAIRLLRGNIHAARDYSTEPLCSFSTVHSTPGVKMLHRGDLPPAGRSSAVAACHAAWRHPFLME